MNSSRRCLAPHDPGKGAFGLLAPVARRLGNGLLPGRLMAAWSLDTTNH